MRGKRAKSLRTKEHPHPGRKGGGSEAKTVATSTAPNRSTNKFLGSKP